MKRLLLATLVTLPLIPAAMADDAAIADWVRNAPDEVKSILSGAVAVPSSAPAPAGDMSEYVKKSDLDALFQQWVANNPKLIYDEVSKYLEANAPKPPSAEEMTEKARGVHDQLVTGAIAPPKGDPDGPVTLVAFFDLRCGFCKSLEPTLKAAVDKYPHLRLQVLDFPILGPDSETAARLALAAASQGKYHALRDKLVEYHGGYGDAEMKSLAESVGLDWDQLKADSQSDAVSKEIERIHGLAQTIGVSGTPYLYAGKTADPDVDESWPGAIPQETLFGSLDKMFGAAPDAPKDGG